VGNGRRGAPDRQLLCVGGLNSRRVYYDVSPQDPEAAQVFQSLLTMKIGDGKRILFWKDNWIGGRSKEEIAPDVVRLVPTRRKNSRWAADALVENKWMSDMVGDLNPRSCEKCVRLWLEVRSIQRNVRHFWLERGEIWCLLREAHLQDAVDGETHLLHVQADLEILCAFEVQDF
jgi:hypothetical protein